MINLKILKNNCDTDKKQSSCTFCSSNNYFCIIIFITFLLLLSLNSCNNTDNITPPDDTPKIDSVFNFGFELGNEYTFLNAQKEKMSLKIRTYQEETWSVAFWDTIQKITYMTWGIEQKVFEGNFPRIGYFGVAENEEQYVLGVKKHMLISNQITLEYYVPICQIPKIPQTGVFLNQMHQSYNGILFRSIDSTIINVINFPDSTELAITTFAKREGFRDGTWEQQFKLLNKKGFIKFWDYNIIN